jgi:hypothetical protein
MATITITPGNSFTATETVTSTKLNDLGSPTAALTAASIGTADIADDAITPALIADNAVTTPAILDANVTFAKLTDVIDDDTMATATDTTLATSESIKAYVDSSAQTFVPASYAGEESVTLPNGLIMKFGTVTSNGGVQSFTFATAFPTACLNLQGQRSGASDDTVNLSYTALSSTGWTMNPISAATYSWTAFGY